MLVGVAVVAEFPLQLGAIARYASQPAAPISSVIGFAS